MIMISPFLFIALDLILFCVMLITWLIVPIIMIIGLPIKWLIYDW